MQNSNFLLRLPILAYSLILLLLLAYNDVAAQQKSPIPAIELRPGLIITTSVKVKPATYPLPASSSLDSSVIIIHGDNITVDFANAVMEGADPKSDPDLYAGVAVRIDSGKNIRILHARIHGYKIGIMARGTQGIELADNDVSNNWKPRLFSLIEHESLVDWLSFHHNENHEWLRYGAGIYLDSVNGGELRGNRCEQGMNGLMMNRCDHLKITDNMFSFNSGLGIGLYRSSDNTIVHNRLDYNVRGYSHRFYHRGQDSADLLVFEQSSRNVIAYNSATHGGDGVFLWAGQTTMDSGNGGANDNLVYNNDFSFSPANGIEATFSRNTFIANILQGCDYGVWGGYSYESKIVGNSFIGNRVGVAIEHGQENIISSNRFDGDTTAISLWATPIAPSDWGYPKYRDTKSRNYAVENNIFASNRYGVKAVNTAALLFSNNRWSGVDTTMILKDTSDFRSKGNMSVINDTHTKPRVPGEFVKLAPKVSRDMENIPTSSSAKMDRSAIIVDEWGPYDWQSPKLWPLDSSHSLPLRLRVLGPAGKWSVVGRRGIAKLSENAGLIGDTITVTPSANFLGDWEITLEYIGKATVSPQGERHEAGKPYRFSFARFEPAIDWNIRFFTWSDSTDPRTKNDVFNAILHSTPTFVQQSHRLDYEWYRPPIRELPLERFAFEATGTVTLAPGTYTLRTISDDGVRVWVDGVLVIDNWTQHGSTLDYSSLSGGKHSLRVEYFQVDGWTEFRLDILRGTNRSPGSPG